MKKLLLPALVIALFVALAGIGVRAALAEEPTPTTTPTTTPTPASEKAWLGVSVAQVPQVLKNALGKSGVIIVQVSSGSPAEKAGLKRGDLLLTWNGKELSEVKVLLELVGQAKVGDTISLTYLRQGQETTVSVTLEARQPPESPERLKLWHGLALPWPKELKDIASGELFGHFLGGELRFLDKEGKPLNLTVVAGAVASVGDGSLTITPNGQTGTVTYTVGSDTVIRKGLKLSDLKAGDTVVVLAVGNEARQVLVGGLGQLAPDLKGTLRRGEHEFRGQGAPGMHGKGWNQKGRGLSPRQQPSLWEAPAPQGTSPEVGTALGQTPL